MSRKLSTLVIAMVGMLASSVIAAQQSTAESRATAVASHDASTLAAAKKPTDKELIERQKICPVSDQPLGSMGEPVKVVVKGRTVFLCCAGCKKKLMADPDKYLKKLDAPRKKK